MVWIRRGSTPPPPARVDRAGRRAWSRAGEAIAESPRPVVLVAVALLACLVVISRRVDAFSNPQFYAEDGRTWFSDAFNLGPWAALWTAYQGHLLLQPRLVALLAAPFGIINSPLIYNIVGLLFQVAPALFLLSRRFDSSGVPLGARLALCAVYLLMPSTELNVTDACAQFHLGILATLVIVAPPPRGRGWKLFDVATIALCAATGAFVYILFPVALLWLWRRRQRWTAVLGAVVVAGVAVQSIALLLAPRSSFGLGASLHDLLLITADRVVLAGLFGEEGHSHLFLAGTVHGTIIAAVVCVPALAIVVYAAMHAPWELRIFGFAAAAFAIAGLAAPLVSAGGNQWDLIVTSRAGERYFLMAQVAFVVTVLWAASRLRMRWVRRGAWTLTSVAFASGLIASWTYPAFPDENWAAAARVITSSPPGTHLLLAIPPGLPWVIDVTTR